MKAVKMNMHKIKHYPHKSIRELNNRIAPYGIVAQKVPKNKDSYFNYYIQPVGYEPFNIFYFRVVPYVLGGMLLKKGNKYCSSQCEIEMRVPFPVQVRKQFKKCFPEAWFHTDNQEAMFLADISLDIKDIIMRHPKTFNEKFASKEAKKVYNKVIKRMHYYNKLSVGRLGKNDD